MDSGVQNLSNVWEHPLVRQASDSDVFYAIACPTRRKLLGLLATRERQVGELVDALKIRQPSVSEQLRVLRNTGLVEVQSVGRKRIYRIQPDGLAPLVDWVNEFSRFWETKLDSLADFLEQKTSEKRR